MKKRFFIVISLLLTLILASCDLLGGSLKDYVEEYTLSAAIELHGFDVSTYPRTANDTVCMSDNGAIYLYLRNPQGFDISFGYTFENEFIQTYYNTKFAATAPITYTSLDAEHTAYKMVFPAAFMQAIDECCVASPTGPVKNISGTVYAKDAETQRDFGTYTLELCADTTPAEPTHVMLQQNIDPTDENAQNACYVICFEIPHSARNNDFDTIQINSDIWKVTYDANKKAIKNGIQLTANTNNNKLATLEANPLSRSQDEPYDPGIYPIEEGGKLFEPDPSGNFDVFYYKTNDKRFDSGKDYTITVTDKAGLTSTKKVSTKVEMLSPVQYQAPGQVVFSDIEHNGFQLTISPCTTTKTGTDVPQGDAFVEYKQFIVSESDPESIIVEEPEEWSRQSAVNGVVTLSLPPNEPGQNYCIKARSQGSDGTNYLRSDEITLPSFHVLRNNHFFVSSEKGSDEEDGYTGSLLKPYKTFSKALAAINEYKTTLQESYPDKVPSDGYYVDVAQDYTASDADFTGSYLINNDSTSFAGKLTIQGVDENGNALSGDSRRTIDAGSSGGLLSWSAVANNTATLSLKNLTFTNGCSNTSGQYAGLFFKTLSVQGNPDNNNEKLHVTITNCDITHMTGSYGYGIYFYGGNSSLSDTSTSTVTITDCTISDNEKTGINHSYAAQGSSYEKLILAGNTKIQNNSDGGVDESLGLIIQSKNVIISNNKGYGVSAGAWAKIDIEGATITNNTDASNNPKNLYLVESTSNSGVVSRAKVTLTGDLSGSKIGVTVKGEPATADAPDVPFATYTSKPVSGAFVSDSGLEIVLGENAANLRYKVPSSASGSISTPAVFDELTATIGTFSNTEVIVQFEKTGLEWSDNELTYYGDIVPTDSYSVANQSFDSIELHITLNSSLPDGTYTFTIFYTYNGIMYKASFDITKAGGLLSCQNS